MGDQSDPSLGVTKDEKRLRIAIETRAFEIGRAVVERLERRGVNVQHTFAAGGEARRAQKRALFAGSARVKATTIASFKGWESRAVVLSIDHASTPADHAAIYAGLTRVKAHPHGSYLTVVCSVAELEDFGRLWPGFEQA